MANNQDTITKSNIKNKGKEEKTIRYSFLKNFFSFLSVISFNIRFLIYVKLASIYGHSFFTLW